MAAALGTCIARATVSAVYRSERVSDERALAIGRHLLTADHELLAAAGTVASLRRELERAVASRNRTGPSYPPVTSMIDALTSAQQQAWAAHEELVALDALLERPHPGACLELPDPPTSGARLPADERSRRWYPAPFDPIGMLLWHLRYRPWWSTLDVAAQRLHRARLALREREAQLDARCDAALVRERLPALGDVLG